MSWLVRSWLFALGLVVVSIAATPAAEKHAAPARDIVFLTFRELNHIDAHDRPAPFLARELVRQAFLIAARDACGLLTRDAALREEISDAPAARVAPFELFCTVEFPKKLFDVCYTLSRKDSAAEKLWEWKFRTDIYSPAMITNLADIAEGLSRGKFKDVLKQEGLGKPVPPARDFAGVPRDAQEQLWEWNEIAVLSALRRIHAEIRAKGESPELLAGLAVGYANLGSLTEYYFSPAHKAFSARALLYAERLLRETDGSAWALWHRAYVRAMVGLHNQGLSDIQAAKKLEGRLPARHPFWTDDLDSFCQGKLRRMLEQAKTRDRRRLARYLNLQAVMYSSMNAVTIPASEAMLEECPDCLRAADALCATTQIGPMRLVTGTAFPLYSKTLRGRLPDVHGFPASLAKRLREAKPGAALQENEIEDEVDFRVQLVGDIKAETSSGRDASEPSLALLGQVIEETQFVQLVRRIQLEGYVWAIPTAQTVATYRPLCAHHRYAAFLDLYSREKVESFKAALSLKQAVDPSELGLVEAWFLNWLRYSYSGIATPWVTIAWCHADPVWSDEMSGIPQGIAGPPDDKKYNGPHMDMMWQTSSKLPAAYAIQVERNWKKAKFYAATVESDFAEDPIVMSALANRYFRLKQFDDAERCAKRKISSSPDYPIYETLAAIYKERGDMVKWKETLVKALDLPAMSLEQASIRDKIAHYHMNRKEWKEAVGFADAAAESYSAWSMMTACRCHEMLGEWAKAEALIRATSERYDSSATEWMLWCHRTGHGDANAADDCARKEFESLGTSLAPLTLQRVGVYYLLKKEPEKALAVFKRAYEQAHNAYDAMHAATVADSLGKAADRDQLLSQIIDANLSQDPQGFVSAGLYKRLAELMRSSLPPGSLKDFGFDKVEAVVNGSPNVVAPVNLEYFVGMFLKNRGESEKSREYLVRCAQSTLYNKFTHILACQVLRDLKIPVPPPAIAKSAETKK
jgi:tetratricopeptide (TPR) repeat protein